MNPTHPAHGDVAAAILRLVAERGAQKSVDPSEVAQAIAAPGEPWQRHLTLVRKVAATMARDGSISILRHNKVISPDAIKGVVRLSLPRAAVPLAGTLHPLRLDHLTVIAPSLAEGVAHVEGCLGLTVPFGTRHDYMGTHNHRLQLGNSVYLEIVALDPFGSHPGRARWFGLDNQDKVRSAWNEGRRLRGWVANTTAMDALLTTHGTIFGGKVPLPTEEPTFDFAIPEDGSLPLDGVAPSLIDHRGDPTAMATIPDLGARLISLILEHPNPAEVEALYRALSVELPPVIVKAPIVRYRALIETPDGLKELT